MRRISWSCILDWYVLITPFCLFSYFFKNEAGARVLTDAIFTHVGIMLKKQSSFRPYIFLELFLASLIDPSNLPIFIPNGNKVTILTGKVDYTFLSMSQASEKPQFQGMKFFYYNIVTNGGLEAMRPSIDGLINIPAIRDQLGFDDLLKIILVEEKRGENESQSLKEALPQLIGEGITL